MTRLVDADKLIEEFKGRCICDCDCCKYQRGAYCGLIDNAPTVEERPHGKWIEHQDCHDDTYYTCSHCGEDWTTIEGDPMDNLMNYCPMCGADMREDGKQ